MRVTHFVQLLVVVTSRSTSRPVHCLLSSSKHERTDVMVNGRAPKSSSPALKDPSPFNAHVFIVRCHVAVSTIRVPEKLRYYFIDVAFRFVRPSQLPPRLDALAFVSVKTVFQIIVRLADVDALNKGIL
jgi:hypothetical protein